MTKQIEDILKSNEYYVYQLIDPDSMLPFYIGKGKGNRCYDHLRETFQTTQNKLKYARIKNIQNRGTEPIVQKYRENLTELEAFELEKVLIAKYGRTKFEGGILTNMTLGGEGVSGYRHSKTTLNLLKKLKEGQNHPNFGKHLNETTRRKISSANKGKLVVVSKETKDKISRSMKELFKNESRPGRKRSIDAITYRVKTPEEKEKIRKAKLGVPMSDNARENMSIAAKMRSNDHLIELGKARKGKPWSESRRKAYEEKKRDSSN